MTRVLITGIMGLAGTYLASDLLGEGYDVYGIDVTDTRRDTLSPAGAHIFVGNIIHQEDVRRVFDEVKPEVLFHLAAALNPAVLPRGVFDLMDINVTGTLNILEASVHSVIKPRILLTSSSAVYGEGTEQTIDEDFPLKPVNMYGLSKVVTEQLGAFYSRIHGLDVAISRSFNNTAPGETRSLVVSELAAQVAEMERGERPPILKVGNVHAIRDYTDTRDVVKAYSLIMKHESSAGVYNISSGVGRPIMDIIEVLSSISSVKFEIGYDESRMKPRQADVSRQIGNSQKIRSRLHWKPAIPFQDTVNDVLNYWRNY